MKNLWLWIGTAVVYAAIYCVASHTLEALAMLKAIGITALLTLPLNINGNVYTLFGNAVSEGRSYALASLFQLANKDAWSIVSVIQVAENGNATAGLSSHQLANKDAWSIVSVIQGTENGNATAGLSGLQLADKDAWSVLSAIQIAENGNATAGLSGFQYGKLTAATPYGIALIQKVGSGANTKTRICGAIRPLTAAQ